MRLLAANDGRFIVFIVRHRMEYYHLFRFVILFKECYQILIPSEAFGVDVGEIFTISIFRMRGSDRIVCMIGIERQSDSKTHENHLY
jgi:hypothetical protein